MATSTNDYTIFNGRVPAYDEEHFPTYINLLKAACLNEKTEDLLGDDDPQDPITKFLAAKPAVKAVLVANDVKWTKADIREDPLRNGKAVMLRLETDWVGTSRQRGEDLGPR